MLVSKGKKGKKKEKRGLPFTYSVLGKQVGEGMPGQKKMAFPFLDCRAEDLAVSQTSLCYILTNFFLRMFLAN